jgi:hypothetical protein
VAAAPSSGLYNVTLALTANEGITSTVIGAATYTTTTFTHAFSGNNDPVNATITDLAGAQSVVDNVRVVIDGSLGDGSVGTENAGTSKIDVVYASIGDTTISGIGAADWALGNAGADTFNVSALGFGRIDGNVTTSNDANGALDQLNLAALTNPTIYVDNITLDLRAEQIFDIELFNIEDGEAGDNFYLNLATVQNNNVAVIDADVGDFVRFTENTVTAGAAQANSWVWDGTTTQIIGSETFRLYTYYDGTTTATTTQIWIENGVTVTTLGG